jgi:uncharacterized protein (DUF169 family)
MCGFVSDPKENTTQDPEDYEAISRKQRHCHVCRRSRDVKKQFVSKDHMSMIVTCDICENKDETDESDKLCCFSNSSSSSNHFIIFTYLNTEMNIEHNRNSYTI